MRADSFMRAFALVFASSCGVQFTPETLVDSLRILSIVSDPPDAKLKACTDAACGSTFFP